MNHVPFVPFPTNLSKLSSVNVYTSIFESISISKYDFHQILAKIA